MLDVGSIGSRLRKTFRGTEKAGDSFIQPGLKMATQLISAAEAAKTRSPQSAQITNINILLLTGGEILSLTDLLKVTFLDDRDRILNKQKFYNKENRVRI